MPELRFVLAFVTMFTIVVLALMTGAIIHEYFYCKRDSDDR
jgi:hypothetical protein